MKKIHFSLVLVILTLITYSSHAQTTVTLFVKNNCSDCEKARKQLQDNGFNFKVQNVDQAGIKAQMLGKIGKDPGFYPIALYEIKEGNSAKSGWFAGYNAAEQIIKKLGKGSTTHATSINHNTSTNSNTNSNPTSTTPKSETAKEMIREHNKWREELGIAPLKWSDELAAYAQEWANELGKKGCKLEHRPRSGKFAQKYGENIYMGYKGYHATAKHAVDSWADEKKYFNFNTLEWDWRKSGHYTQIIWEKSTEVGCAQYQCPDGKVVWVCNYNPPGNYTGEKPYTKK